MILPAILFLAWILDRITVMFPCFGLAAGALDGHFCTVHDVADTLRSVCLTYGVLRRGALSGPVSPVRLALYLWS